MNKTSDVKVVHAGIEITYNDKDNKWEFELRGRNRVVDSLQAAREVIGKPAPKDKKPFKKISAYCADRWNFDFKLVTVTSVAEPVLYDRGRVYFWIVDGDNRRTKVSADDLYPVNAKNNSEKSNIDERTKKIEALRKENERSKKRMVVIKTKDIETEDQNDGTK